MAGPHRWRSLELYCVAESEYTRGFSDGDLYADTDPVPYLNRTKNIPNNVLIGQERLVPGDRLLWMENIDNKNVTKVIFEAHSHCQVIARTLYPKFPDGIIPLLFNILTYQQMPYNIVEAGREFIHLPLPRAWAPHKPNDMEEWSPVAQREADPSFWMPQLGGKSNKKKSDKK
jgi:hypothetical protein